VDHGWIVYPTFAAALAAATHVFFVADFDEVAAAAAQAVARGGRVLLVEREPGSPWPNGVGS
jgi:hypothetical protein